MRSLALWQFIGFSFTALFGTLLHFLYEWTGENVFAALVSGVNESTWEHMKLIYFPMLAFTLIQRRYFPSVRSYYPVKLIGIITALTLIPVLFYTYNGAFGKSPDWLNITIFFVSAGIAYLLEWYLFKNQAVSWRNTALALIIILTIGILFFVFTFYPPKIPLFRDPVTGLYGIN